MKSQFTLFAVILAILALSSHLVVFAEEAATESATTTTETTTNETAPVKLFASPDAVTTFVFPSSTTRKFVIGKPIPLVVGLSNQGSAAFNVSRIIGSFMYPQDFRYFIQNFTRQAYNETVEPAEEKSFVYYFFPDPLLEPRDYSLVVSIFYHDIDGGNFTSVVYNSTISLIESNEPIDLTTLFMYIGILGVAGLLGFLLFQSGAFGKKRSAPRRVIETGTQGVVLDNEWLEGTSAARSPKGTPKGLTQKPKKN